MGISEKGEYYRLLSFDLKRWFPEAVLQGSSVNDLIGFARLEKTKKQQKKRVEQDGGDDKPKYEKEVSDVTALVKDALREQKKREAENKGSEPTPEGKQHFEFTCRLRLKNVGNSELRRYDFIEELSKSWAANMGPEEEDMHRI